jgi:hypothetical protein
LTFHECEEEAMRLWRQKTQEKQYEVTSEGLPFVRLMRKLKGKGRVAVLTKNITQFRFSTEATCVIFHHFLSFCIY